MKASARLVDLVDRGATPAPDDDFHPLLRAFAARVEEAWDADARTLHGEEEQVRQLQELFRFFLVRKRNDTLVRALSYRDAAGIESTVLEVSQADQPFILDTLQLALSALGYPVASSLYLTTPALRDRAGRLVSLEDKDADVPRDTVVRVEIRAALGEAERQAIETSVRARLDIARRVVADFKRMKSELRTLSRALQRVASEKDGPDAGAAAEERALIDWLLEENFILMGVAFYSAGASGVPVAKASRTLGYTELLDAERTHLAKIMSDMSSAGSIGSAPWASSFRSLEESPIHRSGKLDNFLLRSCDGAGALAGFLHLRGLFTFKSSQSAPAAVPLAGRKLEHLLRESGHKVGSLPWKTVTNAFNAIPFEFLFEAPLPEVAALVEAIQAVERTRKMRTHLVYDAGRRGGSYFLMVPRAAYSEDVRHRIGAILNERLGANLADSRVHLGKIDTVLLSFFFAASEKTATLAREELDERVRALVGSWEERFFRELERSHGKAAARVLLGHYAHAFPGDYQLQHTPADAVEDVAHLEEIRRDGGRAIAFAVLHGERDRRERTARLRIYLRRNIYLSTVLPILDNFGLQIVDQDSVRIQVSGGREYFIDTFRVAEVDEQHDGLLVGKTRLIEALHVVFEGGMASDGFNRLVLDAGLDWRDVDLLRAYLSYLRQLGVAHNVQFLAQTFRQNARVTRLLMEYYRTRFDPARPHGLEARRAQCEHWKEEIQNALQEVRSSEEDGLLRLVLNLFEATLRTNRYQERPLSEHLVAFKVDPKTLVLGSEPKPWREIFVSQLQMEGIHLRGGKLARGGIRWSDRLSDYREEILGLMRTQTVKNVLIVPVGAKGGFVLRRPEPAPAARREQADATYRRFIGALLDLTDNLVDGAVRRPQGVICHDDEDPYLVVAADKGTAHLSNVANEISLARGFWLADAFASGGSNGYDHKALAITARGAWESVQRHFRELGIDPDRAPFTVVGIGDMAGDVFGNGMLLSRNIRLLAAFNHQHIFIDPDPDPEASFLERERLFHLPGSTWADYHRGLLSPGGDVHERQAKSLRLSPEASRRLGLEERDLRPEEVIRAILSMEVDLLWNGGIGTFIKASSEDNRDVGDLSNEFVRVNANKVRARIVCEGGNLGVTQAGRIEYALRGGCINTDFIDNSGGVDCSDHEVNLKILLEPETRAGRLTMEARNLLLREVSDDICGSVLKDSRSQGLMLSLDARRSRRDLFSFERLIKLLEERGYLQRERDRVPTLDQLTTREGQGIGMTRPELALLSSFAKMYVTRHFMELPAGALDLEEYLAAYFPAKIGERFRHRLDGHLLGRDIAITVLVNFVVGHAGAAFFSELERESGAGLDRIVRAWLLVNDLFAAPEARREILAFGTRVPIELEYQGLLGLEEALRRGVSWLLSSAKGDRLVEFAMERERYRAVLHEYARDLTGALTKQEEVRYSKQCEEYTLGGFGEAAAERIAAFGYLPAGLDVTSLALRTGVPLSEVNRFYWQVARASQILPLVRKSDDKSFGGRWESLAVRIVRNSFLESLGALVASLLERFYPRGAGAAAAGPWIELGVEHVRSHPAFSELRAEMKRLGTQDEMTIATLQVLSTRLARVAEGGLG